MQPRVAVHHCSRFRYDYGHLAELFGHGPHPCPFLVRRDQRRRGRSSYGHVDDHVGEQHHRREVSASVVPTYNRLVCNDRYVSGVARIYREHSARIILSL